MHPHFGREPVIAGAPAARAAAVAVLVHGRDQDSGYMLDFWTGLGRTDVHCLLPEADERSWYPGRFYDPVEQNEPWLSGALEAIEGAVAAADRLGSLPIVLVGFSQGGCLVAEYLARMGIRSLAAAAVLTGSLMGTDVASRSMPESVRGFPVLVASSEADSWVAPRFVEQTAEVLRLAGADLRVEMSGELEHRIGDRAAKAVDELFDRVIGG
ncbi:MAG: hypothetical protein GEU98_15090 [Pseudonocardiaceae bacterium]|nr:hypothetical protein [Pseudonocardiaceae bacterium]